MRSGDGSRDETCSAFTAPKGEALSIAPAVDHETIGAFAAGRF
jgi:hypothetical protein